MQQVLAQFRTNIARAQELGRLGAAVSQLTTAAIDVSDIYRAQIVLGVSALDHFVHELTRVAMVEASSGGRMKTDAFMRFQIPLSAVALGIAGQPHDDWLGEAIRERHSWLSFQHPDKIADAVRLFSPVQLWDAVGQGLASSPQDVKLRLGLVVDRRHKIAHEADMDPINPGFRWPIDAAMADEALAFVSRVGEAIFKVTT
jgi:hypothetical protein